MKLKNIRKLFFTEALIQLKNGTKLRMSRGLFIQLIKDKKENDIINSRQKGMLLFIYEHN